MFAHIFLSLSAGLLPTSFFKYCTKFVGCESDLDEGGSLFAGRNRLGKALFRCAATRKAGLKLLFLTEIPLLVVTPLCSLRNPPSLLLFLLFCYSGWHSRGAEPTVSAFRSLSLSLSLSPSFLFIFSGIAKTTDSDSDRDRPVSVVECARENPIYPRRRL